MYNVKLQSSYEFYISLFIFITTIILIANQIISYRNLYFKEVKKDILLGEAYKISQMLVNDAGEPENWDMNVNGAKRIGLLKSGSLKTNFLSFNKVAQFHILCKNNYELLKNLLGLDYDFSIVLVTNQGNYLIDCVRPFGEEVFKIERIVALDDGKTYGVLRLWVY